jgi:hypothetical protein
MATKREKAKEQKTSAGEHKSYKKKVALAIVFLVIIAGFYLYETYGSLPGSIIMLKLAGKQLNATSIKAIILQKVNSSPMFNVGYTGQVIINGNDPGITLGFLKYHNDTRTSIDMSDIPVFGNATITMISIDHGNPNYLCIQADNTSALRAVIPSNGTAPGSTRCINASSNGGDALLSVENRLINISSANNINVSSYSVSSYDGEPCYRVSGSGTIYMNSSLTGSGASSSQVPSTFTFDMCLSAQYNIPLTINATFTPSNGGSVVLIVHETTLNYASSDSDVVALPGQVVNAT